MQTILRQRYLLLALLSLYLAACSSGPDFYLKRADQLAAEGKDQDAVIEYRKALQKDPAFGQAYLQLGRLLVRRGSSQEALAALTRAAELLPDSMDAKVDLGRITLTAFLADPERDDLRRSADRVATQLLTNDPKSFEALRIRGYLNMADHRPDEAIESFKKAIEVKPNNPEMVTVLMQNLMAARRSAEIQKLASGALETGKNYGPLYDQLYGYYMNSGHAPEAEGILKLKIANNPTEPFFVIQLADHYLRMNRTEQMESLLGGFVANLRAYPTAPLEAGDFYRRIGKQDRALALYQAGRSSDPGRKLEFQERITAVQMEQGLNQEAAATLDSILKDSPENTAAQVSRADLRMASGRPEEMQKALSELAALVQKNPERSDLRYSLANAQRQMGKDDEAEKTLRELLRRNPNHPAGLRQMADLSIRKRRPDEALKYADRLLAIEPNNLGARLVRTSALALQGLFSQVNNELLRILAENPNSLEAQLQMATLKMEQKHYPEAERIYRKLYESRNTDWRALRGLVTVYLLERQAKKALKIAEEAARRSDNEEVSTLLAQVAAETGDIELALSTARRLTDSDSRNANNWLLIGNLLQRQGKVEEAIASFRRAEELAPGNPLAPAHLGDALGQAGRHGEAVAAYRRSLTLQPADPTLMNNLAWHLAMADTNLDEAMSLALNALKATPDNPQFIDTIGVIYLKSGKGDSALRTFEGLVRREPGVASYRLHLAMSLIGLRQPEKARTELETALQRSPSLADAVEIRKLLASTR